MTKENDHSGLTPDYHVSDTLEEISCASFDRAISYIASDADKQIPECNITFCKFLRDYWVKSVAAEMVQRYITGLAWEGFCPPAEYSSDKALNNIISDRLSNNYENYSQEFWKIIRVFNLI